MSKNIVVYQFTLEQAAKRTGADKYSSEEAGLKGFYIPQTLSREDGKTKETLKIKFLKGPAETPAETEKSFQFELEKLAKGTGGDKYVCKDAEWDGAVYVPRSISESSKKLFIGVQ
jgi:hypothetical protein